MPSLAYKRAPRRRRATTALIAVAALAGVLLVLAPAGPTAAAVTTGAVETTWLGLPTGALLWAAIGAAMLIVGRLATVRAGADRRAGGQPTAFASTVPGIAAAVPGDADREQVGAAVSSFAQCA